MSDITPKTAVTSAREVLPKNLKPFYYNLCFTPHLEEAVEFEGTVSIELGVIENTSTMTLNALDLKILQTQVVISDGGTIEISGLYFDKSTERASVMLRKELLGGSKVVLKQSFKGSMLHHASGFHRYPIKDLEGETRWMGATYMAPNAARTVFPCFDKPASKAISIVTLVAYRSNPCLGNLNIASKANVMSNSREKRVITFNKTPLVSTYILAFAIGDRPSDD